MLSQPGLIKDPEGSLAYAFEKTQCLIEQATHLQLIDGKRSGTTVSVVLHLHHSHTLHWAHVGDSRIVLGKRPTGNVAEWDITDLTRDHKPYQPDELKRINESGGEVLLDDFGEIRVYAKGKCDSRGKRYPGLNMSRSMGDMAGLHDAGISAAPDIFARQISPARSSKSLSGLDRQISGASTASYKIDGSSSHVLLLCSDGVWDFISSEEAVSVVGNYKKCEATDAAEHLAKLAWDRWTNEFGGKVVDDITVLVIHMPAVSRPEDNYL